MGSVIDQDANYRGDFGTVFRSSAIFYKPENVRTTISVSNYWDFKNQLEVGVVLTKRMLSGELVSRSEHRFTESNVLNFVLDDLVQGSIEIESFSSRNLRIPYSAVMAVYETDTSVTMVHSYGRNHSLIELEDDKCLTLGRESCWTIRSSGKIKNTAVFHNGHLAVPEQTGVLILTRLDGRDEKYIFNMPRINPFETYLFDIDQICSGYKEFLGNRDGWATVHFENSTAFTRLLIMWYDLETRELQVTHSNFDYADHETNTVTSSLPAFMKLPKIDQLGHLSATVYPKFVPGRYEAKWGNEIWPFENGFTKEMTNSSIEFRRLDGLLPARIVTGIIGNNHGNCLPFECSVGVFHERRPPKRFHWAIVSKRLNSKIYITDYREIYTTSENSIELIISLYNPHNTIVETVSCSFDSVDELPDFLDPVELFGKKWDMLGEDFGYVSLFSHYGGLALFSSIEKNQAFSLEHSF